MAQHAYPSATPDSRCVQRSEGQRAVLVGVVSNGLVSNGLVLVGLDHNGMRDRAKEQMTKLGIGTLQDMSQAVETLSGGQRQAVAVARAEAFGSKVIILDEPTAALAVRESNQVLKMIELMRDRGLPVILISHNMPQVFQVADLIHVQRLGSRAAVVSPDSHTMNDAVAIMTDALKVDENDQVLTPARMIADAL